MEARHRPKGTKEKERVYYSNSPTLIKQAVKYCRDKKGEQQCSQRSKINGSEKKKKMRSKVNRRSSSRHKIRQHEVGFAQTPCHPEFIERKSESDSTNY